MLFCSIYAKNYATTIRQGLVAVVSTVFVSCLIFHRCDVVFYSYFLFKSLNRVLNTKKKKANARSFGHKPVMIINHTNLFQVKHDECILNNPNQLLQTATPVKSKLAFWWISYLSVNRSKKGYLSKCSEKQRWSRTKKHYASHRLLKYWYD